MRCTIYCTKTSDFLLLVPTMFFVFFFEKKRVACEYNAYYMFVLCIGTICLCCVPAGFLELVHNFFLNRRRRCVVANSLIRHTRENEHFQRKHDDNDDNNDGDDSMRHYILALPCSTSTFTVESDSRDSFSGPTSCCPHANTR